jgi:hypothetical protein
MGIWEILLPRLSFASKLAGMHLVTPGCPSDLLQGAYLRMSETYVYVGSLPSAYFATHADRQQPTYT